MLYTIDNGRLKLSVDSYGAEIKSLVSNDGTEYIWQGSPDSWKESSPVLFPFIGRLTDNSYRYKGKVYPMTIHGFAKLSEFALVEQSDTVLAFELRTNPKIKDQYPLDFVFQVIHTLEEDTLVITYRVTNLSGEVMPFAIGGHPGFNVPLTEGETFEDYDLIFGAPCQPSRIGFTKTCYVSDQYTPFALEDGVRLPLRHDLFDDDAIVLKHAAKDVTLKSRVTGRGVKACYPNMPYIGFWHWPKAETPYICIEPWSALPSRQDVVEEFTCKSDMTQLNPSDFYENSWTVTVF